MLVMDANTWDYGRTKSNTAIQVRAQGAKGGRAIIMNDDLISRQAAITFVKSLYPDMPVMPMNRKWWQEKYKDLIYVEKGLESLPSVHLEPLTDAEQRIFLAAMSREEKVCEEADRNYVREPYKGNLMSDKDNLMSICREIRRKVKGALWT